MTESECSNSAQACFLCGGDVENFAIPDYGDDIGYDSDRDSDGAPDSDTDIDDGNISNTPSGDSDTNPDGPSGGSNDAPAGPRDAPAGPNDPSDGPGGQSGSPPLRDAWMKYFRPRYESQNAISRVGRTSVVAREGIPYTVPKLDIDGHGEVHAHVNSEDKFFIHMACMENFWYLCSVDALPSSYPLSVFELLRTMPTYDALVLSWGHDYSLKPVRKHYYSQYPWRRCDIYGQLARPGRLAANPRREGAADVSSVDHSRDGFFRLPVEIRLQIGLLLSVDDVLALEQASKAFSFLLHDQQFWASRVHLSQGVPTSLLGVEEPFNMYPPHRVSRRITSNKSVVRLTRGPSALANFCRIRVLAKKLQALHDLVQVENSAVPVFPYSTMAYEQPVAASCIAGSLKQKLDRIDWSFQPCIGELEDVGPQYQRTRVLYLPVDIARLTFYFVTVGDERYLTGMLIHARSSGEIVGMGNSNPSEPPEEVDVEGELCGFELAVGSRGIQGLLCVDGEGRAVGDWVGLGRRQAHKLPVTSRLVCRARTKILAMKALFDRSRCIELSVASEHTVRIFEENPYEYDDGAFTMRHNGVWYPALSLDQDADDRLHVWDEHALNAGRLCQGFKPLTWILFGGWDGSALRHITGMSVLLHGKFSPRQFTIKFSYDDAYDVDGKSRERHAMLSTRDTASPELEDGFEEFAIDGAGGEFITNVGMIMHFPDDYVHSAHRRRDFELNGFPVGIEVKTNRARSHAFTVKNDVVRSSPPETYYFAPTDNETPIVGLYAGETSPTMGFQLGVLGLRTK